MTLEDKLKQPSKVLRLEDLQQLNLLRYKAKLLDSQLAHAQRNLRDVGSALEESLFKLQNKAEEVGSELGVEIADWDEDSGLIREREQSK